jgi:DNA-directed RNA polymerase subunit RPC12/RpoP
MNKRELEEELRKTSAGRKFLEEAEPERQTDNLIEFAEEQSVVFPEDSAMGWYLRETLKMLQAEQCEDVTGHWFVDERPEGDREIICSNCEQPIFRYHKLDFDYRPNYCPNCGAKMREEK